MPLNIIIDIVLVAVIVLFAIIGLMKGFFKSFLSFFGTVVSIVISILLAKTVANALLQVSFIDNWIFGEKSLSSAIAGGLAKIGNLGNVYTGGDVAAELTAAKIPAFLSKFLADSLSGYEFTGGELTLAQILSPMFANIIWLIIVTSALFLILKLFMMLLNKLFRRLTKNKVINGVNRFFGLIVGALKGAVIVAFILVVSVLLSSMKFMAPYNEALDKTVIAKPFNSVVYGFVQKNIDLDKLIKDLFPGAKKMTEKEKQLYSTLGIDFAQNELTPENFEVAGEPSKNAITHFAEYNNALLQKIGGNGFTDEVMDDYIEKALDIQDNLLGALNELEAANYAGVEALLKIVDGLYAQFNDIAAYTPCFS